MGGILICSLSVALHQMRAVCSTGNHAVLLEEKDAAIWVCEEVLEEHEWVSPITISLKRRSAGGIGLRTRCSLCGPSRLKIPIGLS